MRLSARDDKGNADMTRKHAASFHWHA